jgi:2-methylisocitrate lyase-like PEP mutase family enzyme
MTNDEQKRLAETFRNMHRGPQLLLLPNAWDAMSARIFEAAGFEAIGTTSGGLAWALGFPDGEQAPWDEVVAATKCIVRTVRVPVTADIEGGYGETPALVARNVHDIIRAGVVGINLEDGIHAPTPIRTLEDAVERIRAAREAATQQGMPLVINARIDLYLKHIGDDETRFAETVRRGKAYLAAGADCVFPIGLADPTIIAELVKVLKAPVNIVGRPGLPDVSRLQRLGVARVSTASGPSLVAMSTTQQIAMELRAKGQFNILESSMTRADAQQLFAPKAN